MYGRVGRAPHFLPEWLNLRVLAGALVIGVLLTCFTLVLLLSTRRASGSSAQITAVLNVIAAPTITPLVAATSQVAPTGASTTSSPGGDIVVGAYVQISGTAGSGLRLRAEPGLSSEVRLLGGEAEVFQVDDGPREVDGYTWWRLVGPSDATRSGWAVADFLVLVQGP